MQFNEGRHREFTNATKHAVLGDSHRSVHIAMSFLCTILLSVGFLSGCKDLKSNVTSPANPDFGHALDVIDAYDDWNAAHSEAAPLDVDVLPAVKTLQGYLTDNRVITLEYPTHSVHGTMGDHAFGAIRDAIESHLPNRYIAYSAFSRNDVEDWLDRHKGKTLVELQIEAASTSLERAKRKYEQDGNQDAESAVAVYGGLLEARMLTQAIQAILDSDDSFSDLAVMFSYKKIFMFKIYGTIPSRADFDRLHPLVIEACDTLGVLHWDLRLQHSIATIVGPDRDVQQ